MENEFNYIYEQEPDNMDLGCFRIKAGGTREPLIDIWRYMYGKSN